MWKDFGEVKFVFISRVGVLCNGALHWVVNNTISEKNVILAVSLSEEKFIEITGPDNVSYPSKISQHSSMCLGTLMEGCLCVFRPKLLPDDLWVMKDYNK
jgi:hypothetical protein